MAENERARATKADDDARGGGDGAPASSLTPSAPPPDLWCSGPLLRAVQRLRLFEDSKHFVDMPLLSSREAVTRDFEALVASSSSSSSSSSSKAEGNDGGGGGCEGTLSPLPPRQALLSLVERHFAPPGTELEAFEPPDFAQTPRDFLPRVISPTSSGAISPTSSSATGGAAEQEGEGEGEEKEGGVREFALRVHRLWPQLCRRQKREEKASRLASPSSSPSPSSSLLGTRGWCVVPGERFRECYYWDSYWSVRGCLASRMPRTAAAIVATLCELSASSGRGEGASLVPNGARSYYLGRSQPPLLADAAAALLLGCRDGGGGGGGEDARKLALEVALPAAKAEHAAWCRWPRTVRVELLPEGGEGGAAKTASLARYRPHAAPGPRPEAWREDTELAEEFLSSEEDRKVLWLALAAAAESGWDFSTRWLAGGVAGGGQRGEGEGEERDCGGGGTGGRSGGSRGDETKSENPPSNPRLGLAHLVVPVDLNVFLARAEAALSTLCLAAGEKEEARRFAGLAGERLKSIDGLLWDPRTRSWADLGLYAAGCGEEVEDMVFRAERRNAGRYASCWSPLWARRRVAEAAKAAAEAAEVEAADAEGAKATAGGEASFLPSPPPSPFSELDLQAVSSLLSSGLVGPGGLVSASLDKESREQWDGENAWPPLQAIVAEGCADAALAAAAASASAAEREGAAEKTADLFSAAAAAAEAASELSERVVRALVANVKSGLERDGCVREKYKSGDAGNEGRPGEGGEYETQVGFGWSNGAVLCLLRRFGWPPSARGAAEAGEVGD